MTEKPVWRWLIFNERKLEVSNLKSPGYHVKFYCEQWLGENWESVRSKGGYWAQLMKDKEPVSDPVLLWQGIKH